MLAPSIPRGLRNQFAIDEFTTRGLPRLMTKPQIVSEWTKALDSGTFLAPKHDPASLSITFASFRTVLTPEASSSLASFIKSGDYSVRQYEDSKFPNGPGIFEIVPSGSSPFKVAGSGVASGSLTPSGSYDRLVVVSGSNQGWHTYAEDSSRITGSAGSGRWTFKQEV